MDIVRETTQYCVACDTAPSAVRIVFDAQAGGAIICLCRRHFYTLLLTGIPWCATVSDWDTADR